MALPLTRDETLIAGSQVKSSLLNKLQDMIVGGKHGAIDIPIGGAAFVINPPGTGALNNAGLWTFSTAPNILTAPLLLPVGAVLNTLTLGFNRNGAGTITSRTYKRNVLTGANSVIDTTAISAGTGYTSQVIAIGYTVEAAHEVLVEISIGNIANQFGGAIINVSKP